MLININNVIPSAQKNPLISTGEIPMFRNTLPIGWADVTVGALCPSQAERQRLPGWHLHLLQTQDDVQKYYPLAIAINTALRRMKIRKAYAPNVGGATGRIVETSEFKTRVRLGTVDLYRSRDIQADGIFLRPGDSFATSGTDCPLILAAAGDLVIAAYAANVHVVDAIVKALAAKMDPDDTISMCLQLCTKEYEAALIHHAMHIGIRGICAMGSLCNYLALEQTQDGKDPDRRTLIVVKREC